MTPHPDISEEVSRRMVEYILSFDEREASPDNPADESETEDIPRTTIRRDVRCSSDRWAAR